MSTVTLAPCTCRGPSAWPRRASVMRVLPSTHDVARLQRSGRAAMRCVSWASTLPSMPASARPALLQQAERRAGRGCRGRPTTAPALARATRPVRGSGSVMSTLNVPFRASWRPSAAAERWRRARASRSVWLVEPQQRARRLQRRPAVDEREGEVGALQRQGALRAAPCAAQRRAAPALASDGQPEGAALHAAAHQPL